MFRWSAGGGGGGEGNKMVRVGRGGREQQPTEELNGYDYV